MKVKWLHKVFADGNHNGFTALAFFKGRHFLAFRNGRRHADEEGRQVLMTSRDGEQWAVRHSLAFSAEAGPAPGTTIDYRDSYFLRLEDELRLYSFSTPVLADGERQPFLSRLNLQVTRDGETWSEPRVVHLGSVLWKPIFWRNEFWCAGYKRFPERGYGVELFRSPDGEAWTRQGDLAPGNECCLAPVSDDRLRAFVRTDHELEIWESHFPGTAWQKVATAPAIIQSPHVETVRGGLYLFGRHRPEGGTPSQRRTKIWRVRGTAVSEVLELPSLGDTAYAGTAVRPDGLLVMSYYSQHERELDVPEAQRGGNDKPADVFVAGIEQGD